LNIPILLGGTYFLTSTYHVADRESSLAFHLAAKDLQASVSILGKLCTDDAEVYAVRQPRTSVGKLSLAKIAEYDRENKVITESAWPDKVGETSKFHQDC